MTYADGRIINQENDEIIINSGYPLHRSVFQWGPAKIMYNTVTIQYDKIRNNIRDTIYPYAYTCM